MYMTISALPALHWRSSVFHFTIFFNLYANRNNASDFIRSETCTFHMFLVLYYFFFCIAFFYRSNVLSESCFFNCSPQIELFVLNSSLESTFYWKYSHIELSYCWCSVALGLCSRDNCTLTHWPTDHIIYNLWFVCMFFNSHNIIDLRIIEMNWDVSFALDAKS